MHSTFRPAAAPQPTDPGHSAGLPSRAADQRPLPINLSAEEVRALVRDVLG